MKKTNNNLFMVKEFIRIAKSYTAGLNLQGLEQKALAPKLELGIILHLITEGMEKIVHDYILMAMKEQNDADIEADDFENDLDAFETAQYRDFKGSLHELRELQIASGENNIAELMALNEAAYFGETQKRYPREHTMSILIRD
jgi:hypothetical protein